MKAVEATPAIQVSYQPEISIGEDFGIFLRPRQISLTAEQLAGGALSISWRLGGDYLVYDQPLRTYAHEAPAGEWTAFGVPWPSVPGLLTFELLLRSEGRPTCQIATGELIADAFRRLRRRDLWVSAWSVPSFDAASQRTPMAIADPSIRCKRLLDLDSGLVLTLVSIILDTVAPPEAIIFDRFPYDFGAARLSLDVPHGPEDTTHFLLPISSFAAQSSIPATIVAVGGYQRSRVDLASIMAGT